jgi:hypothetical protein
VKSHANQTTVIDYILLYLSPSHPDYAYLKEHSTSHTTSLTFDWSLNAEDDEIPCKSKARVCYTPLDLLVTLTIVFLILGTLAFARWLVNKKDNDGYQRLN